MKLILQKDVKNLGKTGDQVLVKKGYARNFLIPRGMALPLNKDRLKVWKHQQVIIEAKKRKAVAERKLLVEKLSSIKLKFEKESQKDGRLYGSVTAHEISQTLEKLHNISVDKRDISITALKSSGDHTLTISLDSDHKANLLVSIKGKAPKKKKMEDHPEAETKDSKEKKPVGFLQKAKMAFSLKSKKSSSADETDSESSGKTLATEASSESSGKTLAEDGAQQPVRPKTSVKSSDENNTTAEANTTPKSKNEPKE